jgi:hypothetical protein
MHAEGSGDVGELGDRCLACGSKRGCLFVSHVLPGQRAVAAHGIREAIQRIAGQAVNPLHT